MSDPNREEKAIGNLIKLRNEQGDHALFAALYVTLHSIHGAMIDAGDPQAWLYADAAESLNNVWQEHGGEPVWK